MMIWPQRIFVDSREPDPAVPQGPLWAFGRIPERSALGFLGDSCFDDGMTIFSMNKYFVCFLWDSTGVLLSSFWGLSSGSNDQGYG